MQAVSEPPSPAAFAELQDELLIATTDLDRLQSLLSDAAGQLLTRFVGADALLVQLVAAAQQPTEQAALLGAARAEVAGAAIALQFQDMAAQLLSHALQRVRSVADCLGNQAMPADADTEAGAVAVQFVARACPVAQRQMDAGSIELY